jgi:hypothetical protein
MRTLGPKYCGTRMLDDYVKQVYAPPPGLANRMGVP